MPETPREFFERVAVLAAAQPDGRLPVPSDFADSDIFPFEADGLRVKELERPVIPEPAREGDPGGDECSRCERGEEGAIWADERWLLVPPGEPVGLPFAALLMPRDHVDFGDLDGMRAGEIGRLLVAIEKAVKSLGDIGRVHVNIWGDGGSHLHVWILARPLGQLQLRGSCLADWLDLLPIGPKDIMVEDQRRVAEALVESYGGRSLLD